MRRGKLRMWVWLAVSVALHVVVMALLPGADSERRCPVLLVTLAPVQAAETAVAPVPPPSPAAVPALANKVLARAPLHVLRDGKKRSAQPSAAPLSALPRPTPIIPPAPVTPAVISVPEGVPSLAEQRVPPAAPGPAGEQTPRPAQPSAAAPKQGSEDQDAGQGSDEPAASAVDTGAIKAAYRAVLSSRVRDHQFYPEAARAEGLTGSVTVNFQISASGALAAVSIKKSSGYKLLDQAAIQAVRSAAPFDPIPAELRKSSMSLDIPLKYSVR